MKHLRSYSILCIILFTLLSCKKTIDFSASEMAFRVYEEGDARKFLGSQNDTLIFSVPKAVTRYEHIGFNKKDRLEHYYFDYRLSDGTSGFLELLQTDPFESSNVNIIFRFKTSDKSHTIFIAINLDEAQPTKNVIINGFNYSEIYRFEKTLETEFPTDDELVIYWYSTQYGIVKIENKDTEETYTLIQGL